MSKSTRNIQQTRDAINKKLGRMSPLERDSFFSTFNKQHPSPTSENTRTEMISVALNEWSENERLGKNEYIEQSNDSSTSTLISDKLELNVEKTEIGPFKVIKTIGEGTFGKVRLCQHKLSLKKVAIKTILRSEVQTVKQKNSVQREVRLMKLLYHPNIIKVYNIEEGESEINLVMEYASGGELFDYIVSKGMIKDKEARMFFRQILSAVDYCHQNNVIHRGCYY